MGSALLKVNLALAMKPILIEIVNASQQIGIRSYHWSTKTTKDPKETEQVVLEKFKS